MASNRRHELLLDLLSDEVAIQAILAESEMHNLITEIQKGAIKTPYRHLVGEGTVVSDDIDEPRANGEPRSHIQHYLTGARPLPIRTKSRTSSWSRFTKIKELKISDVVLEHIETHGTKAIPFFSREAMSHGVEKLDDKKLSDAFTICYRNTSQLKQNIETDRILRLFHMLQYYDIC